MLFECRLKAGLNPVSCLRNARSVSAVGAAEELVVVLNSMPYDATSTVEAGRRKGLNRALEGVKCIGAAGLENVEGFVVFVVANGTCSHDSRRS